jgi:hypothetical protein
MEHGACGTSQETWGLGVCSWQIAAGSRQQQVRRQGQFISHLPSASLGHDTSLSFFVRDAGMGH